MVLTGSHGGYVFAITHDDKTGFFTLQKLFNHHTRPTFVVSYTQGVEIGVGCQHELDGFMRLMQRHGHYHAFSGCQAIGLDHNRRAFFVHVGMRSHRIGKSFIVGRRNTVALHEGFGKSF